MTTRPWPVAMVGSCTYGWSCAKVCFVTDVTAIAVAAISSSAALGGAWLQAHTSTRVNAETRRNERKQTYAAAIDLLTDYGWRTQYEPDYSANIVQEFTIPFIHMANRVRLYCSPASIEAIDKLQEAFTSLNAAHTDSELEDAEARIAQARDMFVNAARADVGPRRQDRLATATFRPGAGPPA